MIATMPCKICGEFMTEIGKTPVFYCKPCHHIFNHEINYSKLRNWLQMPINDFINIVETHTYQDDEVTLIRFVAMKRREELKEIDGINLNLL